MLEITKTTPFILNENDYIELKTTGNVITKQYMQKVNNDCPITVINKDLYLINKEGTGEVYECNHILNRSEGIKSLKRTFSNLRDLVNSNVIDVNKCRWVTLTYAKNMTNETLLKSHLKRFRKNIKAIYGDFEYISVREPQGRGAWHFHIIMLFSGIAPFMDNKIVFDCWSKKGWVTVRKLDNVDNVGAYVTAYLSDVDLDICKADKLFIEGLEVKEINIEGDNGEIIKKKYVKGARLYLYPPKMNLYTCSKSISRATKQKMFNFQANKILKHYHLKNSVTYTLIDKEKEFSNIIHKEQYNKICKRG